MKQLRSLIEFLHRRRPRWPRVVIMTILVLAVFGDFIANDKPVYCKVDGESYFPLLRAPFVALGIAGWPENLSGGRWKSLEYEKVIYTLIPYAPSGIDSKNGNFRSPFGDQNINHWRFRHWLGTDALGRDVTSGLIRGCRIAVIVGILSMLIAVLLGVPIGALAGYFGDDRRRKPWPITVAWGLALMLSSWYVIRGVVYISRYGDVSRASMLFLIGCLVIGIAVMIDRFVSPKLPDAWKRGVPWDFTVLRGVEVVRSIPAFFLLFALLSIVSGPSLVYVVLLIGLLRTPTIIRYVRAESMKLRDLGFVDSARVIGLSDTLIIIRHIIPNALGPVMVTVAFGIGGAVLLESGLSFLGIGLSIDQMSWGRLLNEARTNFSAWWLAALPGAAIFLTVAAFNRIGEDITRWIDGTD